MNSESTLNSPPDNRDEELNDIVELVSNDLKGTIPRDVVYEMVSSLYRKYDKARVRSFISVLVRRNAKDALAK